MAESSNPKSRPRASTAAVLGFVMLAIYAVLSEADNETLDEMRRLEAN